ncbi:MAG: BACON domain-containing protein [Bacteroidales bacterium]|nr:BACON domain-containing protein [Candidatus Cryptobacteroides aphodequi]
MKKSLFIVAAASLVLAACVEKPTPTPQPVKVPEISAASATTLAAKAEGEELTLSIASNSNWKVTADADWVSFDPASYTAEADSVCITVITITVDENTTYERRTANITVTAEGVEAPVTAKVNQAAAVKRTLEAIQTDGEGTPFTEASFGFYYGEQEFLLDANVNWVAESNADWIYICPNDSTALAKFEGEPSDDYIELSIYVTINKSGTERNGTLTITGEGIDTPVTIAVSQGVPSVEMTAELKGAIYNQATINVTAPENTQWFYVYFDEENYNTLGSLIAAGSFAGVEDYILYAKLNTLVKNNITPSATNLMGTYFTALGGQVGSQEIVLNDLAPDSKFYFCAAAFDAAANFLNFAKVVEIQTPTKPTADPNYSAYLGTYNFNANSYFDDKYVDFTLYVGEYVVNEAYTFYIDDIMADPDDYNIALFDAESNVVDLPLWQYGALGTVFNIGKPDAVQTLLVGWPVDEEDKTDIDDVVFGWNAGKTGWDVLAPSMPVQIGWNWVYADGTGSGYAVGYLDDFTITKKAAGASVKNVKNNTIECKGVSCYCGSFKQADKTYVAFPTPFTGRK